MFERLRRAWSGTRPAILMYHRVAKLAHDPWGMAVAPDRFAEQLQSLRRTRTVLPADDFIQRHRLGTLPRDAVAITFDDGYIDNLSFAAPALKAEDLSATLFLSTGPMRRALPYWYDELSAMILDASAPGGGKVSLPEGDLIVEFGPREDLDDRREGWRAWEEGRTERERCYQKTWDRIRRLDPVQNRAAMDELRLQLPSRSDDVDRPMTASEVLQLVESGHFTLGGHTLDHPDLLEMNDRDALEQIEQGKAETEAVFGTAISGFAYPYGRYDARVRALVGKAGFTWACTTAHGFVSGDKADLLGLPRVASEDRADIDWLN